MLTFEEEHRLAGFLAVTQRDLEKDVTFACEYYVSAVRWLAEKLKETNEELKVANTYSSTVAKELEKLRKKKNG